MTTTARRTPTGWLGTVWGCAGVGFLLAFAILRLTPPALESLRSPLTGTQAVALAASVLGLGVAQGTLVFQRVFSPRVAARCLYLCDHPTPLRVALAPLFALAFFGATRRRLTVAYGLGAGILVLVYVVRRLEAPWRGIVYAGVVVSLTWGLVALGIFWFRALLGEGFDVSPEVDEARR